MSILIPGRVLGESKDSDYQQLLIEQAVSQKLAERPVWRALLHYERLHGDSPGGSYIDGGDFFASVEGGEDPSKELVATIAAFFDPSDVLDEYGEHSQCKYKARFEWLNKQLGFDETKLTHQPCARFDEWLTALNPKQIALIFPAAYLNNPASAFGHTLFRVDSDEHDDSSRLLSYAVNYAANTSEENGIVFAMKGIMGGYAGVYSVLPYYKKVKEYNDLENRDVWEYGLDLSQDEVRFILMHVWELRHAVFDYYFFDENCSFHLLALLEAVRPELNLTSEYTWAKIRAWVIPPDTVRVMAEREGLINTITYRPAIETRIRFWEPMLSREEKRLVKELVDERLGVEEFVASPRSPETTSRVLEFAFDYLDYQRLSVEHKNFSRGELARELLIARSRLPQDRALPPVPSPKFRPEQGHPIRKISLNLGIEEDDLFSEFSFRPAFHDLLDPQEGYVDGAQIDFFEMALRYDESERVRFERFVPVRIVSLVPSTYFLRQWSWRLGTSLHREMFDAKVGRKLVASFEGGPGITKDSAVGRFFALASTEIKWSEYLDEHFSLGMGAESGILFDVTNRLRLAPRLFAKRFFALDAHTVWGLEFGARLRLDDDFSMRLGVARERGVGSYLTKATISVDYFF